MPARIIASLLILSSLVLSARAEEQEPVGKRPYEMVWADRTEDTRKPLVDFENLDGWTVKCEQSDARFTLSRRQQLWGRYVGKLAYRGDGRQPVVVIQPPKPIPVTGPLDCVNLWVYGNNWAWSVDKTTPRVEIVVLLVGKEGRPVRVSMGRVRWKEWWLMHRRLTPEQIALLADGRAFEGIEIRGGTNKDDRLLYFDNLAVYKEQLPPLEFAPRPGRAVELPEGQTVGTNTGPGKLPFPNREETILPDNLTKKFDVKLEATDKGFAFHYQGDDGHLVYRYQPLTGTLGDVTAQWVGRGEPFRPMADGGVYFQKADSSELLAPEAVRKISCRQAGDTVVAKWRCAWGGQFSTEVVYTLRLWQKSLVIDVKCLGGVVGEVRLGRAVGVDNPRLVTLPFLACGQHRPAVLITGPVEKPLFVMLLVDHTRSNASELWAENKVEPEGVVYNGGSRYSPKTDGRRNPCFERLFLTVSPRFEEVLPNVPNPKSPWMHMTGKRVWRAHGASNREGDYDHWKRVARHGMTQIVVTDHETGWRDGGESFTMRTRAAPGKGGDEGQLEYARKMLALGFVYGPYNNYTDYAPVNRHWNEDWVSRMSDGDWRRAWARCYNPKPARAVEVEARLAPMIQEKFHFNTAYCDVHTAVQPWRYCDFDARVPGAGTFAATFYAYGEIMLHQKRTWNGPVYSEGNNHWYYCGLTDGNYGQDQLARLAENPWLVDFDLRKLHPLCCNFGMGNVGMFFGRRQSLGGTPEEREARLDKFLAATLAFGHTGFLVMQGGMQNTVRSYFTVQQIHARYAEQTAVDIRYADQRGTLLDTSAAVAADAFRRSQVATTYSDGLRVFVNGHPTDIWKVAGAKLPPNGWVVDDSKAKKLVAFSALVDGRRADYVDSPAYIYADGRGRFTRFDKAACDGQMIALLRADGTLELIPVGGCESFGVSLAGRTATAVALDAERKPLGPAETRLGRGLVYVTPVKNAFSYVLTPGAAAEVSLKCERDEPVPGEVVNVSGKTQHSYRIPADAVPGSRIWQQFDGAWIDFTVRPLVDTQLALDGDLHLQLRPRLAAESDAKVTLAGQTQTVKLVPGKKVALVFPFQRPEKEAVSELPLTVTAGELIHHGKWYLKTELDIVTLAELSNEMQTGQCLRKQAERPLGDHSGAQVVPREMSCGEVSKQCIFMHPPYKTGVGYSFALLEPVQLPKAPRAAFRCKIGKADGSDPGDGILFRVAVVAADGGETVVAEKQWIKHAWTPLEADLSPWAGQTVRIKLIADVGPGDNSSGDWAAWTGLKIESTSEQLVPTLHDQPVRLLHEPGQHPPQKGLAPADPRKAKRGVLHFQGMGLQSSGRYVSQGSLNGVPLGQVPGAGGQEAKGIWSDAQIVLPPEAIATLGRWNTFKLKNPGGDNFKIGRFRIELDLADGRICSSDIATTVYTQPPEWLYAEGTGVPLDEEIEARIRFSGVVER